MIRDLVLFGDCRKRLSEFDDLARMCVTSPPYYGLRNYGDEDDQIGIEQTPEDYVNELVKVFREVKNNLTEDGTLWLNIGDSYYNYRPGKGQGLVKQSVSKTNQDLPTKCNRRGNKLKGYKEKDLIGIPWLLAFALRKDGWYLRQDIIWSKPNPMPESVRDRCTKSHEYIFLFAHFAVFPEELIKPCILAGSQEGDLILDPFMGSGTTAVAAKSLNRDYIGCELNQDYNKLITKRLYG